MATGFPLWITPTVINHHSKHTNWKAILELLKSLYVTINILTCKTFLRLLILHTPDLTVNPCTIYHVKGGEQEKNVIRRMNINKKLVKYKKKLIIHNNVVVYLLI